MTTPTINPDGTLTTPPEDKGKTFTQEEVNAIVRDRLERQKAQLSKDAEALRAGAGEAEETRKVLDSYRKQVTALVDERKKALPAAVLALLEKLEPLDQLEWLAKNPDQVTRPIPPAPKPEQRPPDLEAAIAAKRAQMGAFL